MKFSIRITGPQGSVSYLTHRGNASWCRRTAEKHRAYWLKYNAGTAEIEPA